MKNYSVETQCVQAGYEPKSGEPRVAPIVQSTTYKYDDADQVAALFDLSAVGHMYSRISNPTVEVLEKKLAVLEGGVGALGVASGQSANFFAIFTLCSAGDNFICLSNLYGGTHTLFTSTLKRMGIEATILPCTIEPKEISKYVNSKTKLLFAETLGNPGVEVLDIEAFAKVAHDNKLAFVVDNTFATPYLCRPIEHGADIVTHSATKYLDGHATSLGGVIVDSGNFDWNNGNFDCLTQPDPAYHGLSYTETFGNQAFIVKARASLLRDLGSTMSPNNAFLINLGTETLALRMQRHSDNALEVAKFLQSLDEVAWVNYPKLEGSKDYKLAEKYLPKGASGVISFGVKGGVDKAKLFINSVKLASLVVHVGDLRTHVLHPANITHRQLSEEQQIKAGIAPEMIRLSVGIENSKDICDDLYQALKAQA